MDVLIAGRYAGEREASAVFEAVSLKPSAALIDVRSERELVASQAPDLRGAARGRVVQLEVEALSGALRGQVAEAVANEERIFAIRARALTRGKKEVYIMDTEGGGTARAVRISRRQ
jgi:hypothetical protein